MQACALSVTCLTVRTLAAPSVAPYPCANHMHRLAINNMAHTNREAACRSQAKKNSQRDPRPSLLYTKPANASLRETAEDGSSVEAYSLAKIKERLKRDWHPEYEPESVVPHHVLDISFGRLSVNSQMDGCMRL